VTNARFKAYNWLKSGRHPFIKFALKPLNNYESVGHWPTWMSQENVEHSYCIKLLKDGCTKLLKCGQIRPFKNAHTSRTTDRELLNLSKYLKDIAELDDLSSLNHKHWERYVISR
jgi:hypothetical protein